MVKVVVTIVCALGWLAALGMIVAWRGTRRPVAPDLEGLSGWARLQEMVGRVAGGVAGGVVASVLTIGLGGRLMMRVLAATSPDTAQGRLTDAEEIVGDVSTGGTIGFVVFLGVFGGFVGLAMFSLLRRWLPDRSAVAGLLTVTVGAGLLARPSGLLDPDNPDFAILEPNWLAVAVILAMLASYGALTGILVDRLMPVWPRPRSLRSGLALLPVLPLLVLGAPGPILIAAVLFGAFLAPKLRAKPSMPRIDRVGRAAVLLAVAVSGAWLLVTSAQVLAV